MDEINARNGSSYKQIYSIWKFTLIFFKSKSLVFVFWKSMIVVWSLNCKGLKGTWVHGHLTAVLGLAEFLQILPKRAKCDSHLVLFF